MVMYYVHNCGSFLPCIPFWDGLCRLAVRPMYLENSSQQFQIQVQWALQHGTKLRLWLSGTRACTLDRYYFFSF